MFDLYSKFIDENEDRIIEDYCEKIKKEAIGDLTLDEYSRFLFWKDLTKSELNHFYENFKEETKATEMPYDLFCELMWNTLGDSAPDNIKEIINMVKGINVGEA